VAVRDGLAFQEAFVALGAAPRCLVAVLLVVAQNTTPLCREKDPPNDMAGTCNAAAGNHPS
jgi:hypothetical protein